MTLEELRAVLRLTLGDATAWPDAALDRWVQSAIRLYSAHFPRRIRAELALEAGTQAYPLPGGASTGRLIAVEYPVGRLPPRFLRCASERSPRFASGAACYALRGAPENDLAAGVCANCVGEIVFAEPVADGETAAIEYWGPHALPAVGADEETLTLPAQHIEAITAYVEFAAHFELETDEALAADGSTIVLAQLGAEARRAWNRYKEVMDRLAWLGGPQVDPCEPTWPRYGLGN